MMSVLRVSEGMSCCFGLRCPFLRRSFGSVISVVVIDGFGLTEVGCSGVECSFYKLWARANGGTFEVIFAGGCFSGFARSIRYRLGVTAVAWWVTLIDFMVFTDC